MPRTPSYRRRSGSSQAIVTLPDSVTRKRKDYWLGEYDSSESREIYHRLIAEWEGAGRRLPDWQPNTSDSSSRSSSQAPSTDPENGPPTITVLVAAYWNWAQGYYQPNESGTLRVALRLIRQHHGSEPADEFGPRKLRILREAMIVGATNTKPPRRPWSRLYVNHQVRRIRSLFKWAASHEMISADIYRALATVEPLKRGRTAAHEGSKVGPVPQHQLDDVRPFLSRPIRTLVELQLLTGARPGELLGMKPSDLDRQDPSGVWLYRPQEHKNQFRGTDRVIYLGPKAQAVIRPFLVGRDPEAHLFSPIEAEAERRAILHASRKTRLKFGNRPGTNRQVSPKRTAGDRYTTPSYLQAIRGACDKAYPPPPPLAKRENETNAKWNARLTPSQKDDLKMWRKSHRWHPHQLRHNAATDIRKAFGLEAAQLALGHASAQITDAIYAERDHSKVIGVMKQVG